MIATVKIAAVLVAFVVGVLALVWLMQRRLIYFPTAYLPSLGEAGITGGEPVTFETSDGLRLGAWFFAGSGPPPRLTLLVFPGNAGNRFHRVPLAASLRTHGVQVVLIDYRGYGGNPGSPTEEGLAIDARAALSYLHGRADVDRSRLVYFGESLGTGVAVRLATEHAPAGLILRSPFTSMVDVGRYHYPVLPVSWLLRDRFPSIDRASQVRSPVLVIAGDRDSVVPIDLTRRLYAAFSSAKTLVEIPGADHNDDALLDGAAMIDSMLQFVRRL
ncbi:MAG TPA: alpha/beta hydrolase [Vicinamibacterales bacterium]|jgi:hypothetical protein